jgi:hypothetical protein
MTNKCSKCGYAKENSKNPYCRACHRKYHHEHYQKNKEKYLAKANKRKGEMKLLIRRAKEKPCADCGLSYPYYVMDFDHREKKEINVSSAWLLTGFNH